MKTHWDVVVVGGGIAGVATAERLVREARRQGRELSLLLIERRNRIGLEASGSVGGWYHTGALYARLADPSALATCLRAVEDLINWYSRERDEAGPLFPGCNYATDDEGKLGLRAVSEPWFEGRVGYQFGESSGDATDAEWTQVKRVARRRLARCFSEWRWARCDAEEPGRAVQAPRPADFEDDAHDEAMPAGADILPALDSVMRTEQILGDLVQAAAVKGAVIRCGHELVRVRRAPLAGPFVVDAVEVVDRERGDVLRLTADQYIFASGASLGDGELGELLWPGGLVRRDSVLVAARLPAAAAPVQPRGEAVLGRRGDEDVNFVLRQIGGQSYVVCGDSNSSPCGADERDRAVAARRLIEKARERWSWMTGLDFTAFAGTKTELEFGDRPERRYLCWQHPDLASHAATWGERPPNCLVLLPGKFSLFPTVAHRAYLEMEARALFGRAQPRAEPREGRPGGTVLPALLVAPPRAAMLLGLA